ncbi:MAG: HAD family hydrolase [Halobacteria archaeon]
MEGKEAVIYDLDGTLVELEVDWGEVRMDVAEILSEAGIELVDSTWGMLDKARQNGCYGVVNGVIERHEVQGAIDSRLLQAAQDVPDMDGSKLGVCSLNAEKACRKALEIHGIEKYFGSVVGRDSVEGMKPDPGPLLRVLSELDVSPENAVFIGDSQSDEEAAERAGIKFIWV